MSPLPTVCLDFGDFFRRTVIFHEFNTVYIYCILQLQQSSVGCSVALEGAMGGLCGREYYISQLRWSRGKIHAPGAAAGVQA